MRELIISNLNLDAIKNISNYTEIITFYHIEDIPEFPVNNRIKDLRILSDKLSVITKLPISIKILSLTCVSLHTIEVFPPNLKELHINSSNLSMLPDLPLQLSVLTINYINCFREENTVEAMEENRKLLYNCSPKIVLQPFHNNINKLIIKNTNICSLPNIPEKLQFLNISGNLFTELIALPNNLVYLNVSNNYFVKLPELPVLLEELNCNNNNLTILPDLPNGLKVLQCNFNKLKVLPILPNNMLLLYCSNNELITLPDNLPNTLRTIKCDNNNIIELPTLPEKLQFFDFYNNNIGYIESFPEEIIYIEYGGNPFWDDSKYELNDKENIKRYNIEMQEMFEISLIGLK